MQMATNRLDRNHDAIFATDSKSMDLRHGIIRPLREFGPALPAAS